MYSHKLSMSGKKSSFGCVENDSPTLTYVSPEHMYKCACEYFELTHHVVVVGGGDVLIQHSAMRLVTKHGNAQNGI